MSRKIPLIISLFVITLVGSAIISLFLQTVPPPLVAAPPPTTTPNPSPRVVSIAFSDTQQLRQITGALDVWSIDHKRNQLTAQISALQHQSLVQNGFTVTINEAKTVALDQPLLPLPGQVSGIPGYPCYRTVEETHEDLAQLAANYPALAAWIDIGDSWQKTTSETGYDIFALVLTNHDLPGPKPKFLLLSTVHARELATAELTTRFAEYLLDNYNLDPDVTWLLDYFEIHLIPQANPDGRKHAEMGLFWRKNVDNDDGCEVSHQWGVDLNRNSSFRWNSCAGCSSGDPCSTVYRGPAPVSEPENKAIEDYTVAIFPDQRGPADDDAAPAESMGIFITLHSYGEWILFPWGWTPASAPNNSQLETLGRKFGFYTDYVTCQAGEPGCIYLTDGTHDDWAYGALGLAAYTFEVGTTFFQQCSYFENIIIPENFPALLYAFKATRRPYQTPAGPETLQVTVTPTTVIASHPVTLTVLADDTRYDSNGWGEEPTQAIAAVRYSVAAPAWVTGTDTFPLVPVDGLYDSPAEMAHTTIDTTGWAPGRHHLFIESQDADGNWGVPSATFLWVIPDTLIISPPQAVQWANAGQSLSYEFQAYNNETSTPPFTVTLSGHTWPTTAPLTIGPFEPDNLHLPLPVTVQVPITATANASDTVIIHVQVQPALQAATVQLTTRVQQTYFLPIVFSDDTP